MFGVLTRAEQAAIFSAVLITLVIDSKTLLEQDKTDVLIDAVVFLMNNLANGTHRPYTPPTFQPSTRPIVVNSLLFASLCLSIATALAAVVAMQWVTDYGAVTKRVGSTPEERMKRRHYRYQGGLDWKMDTIIGALPIALHVSVLLFFVGMSVWMWDVHRSVFGVVIVCGAMAMVFYVFTTVLAIFYPSCPYRTPLASWIYILFHFIAAVLSNFRSQRGNPKSDEGDAMTDSPHPRFREPSLSLRDSAHMKQLGPLLTQASQVWLSNHIAISPEVYKRLLVLINGLSSIPDPLSLLMERGTRVTRREYLRLLHLREVVDAMETVPWMEIFQALGTVYQSFIEEPTAGGDDFIEFACQTHCLSRGDAQWGGLRARLDNVTDREETRIGDAGFPIQLLCAWVESLSAHTSDELRNEQFRNEVRKRESLSKFLSPKEVLQIWYKLLSDKAKDSKVEEGEDRRGDRSAHQHILSHLLENLASGSREDRERRLDTTLYLISTGGLPWDATVQFDDGKISLPPTPLLQRLRAADWVDNEEEKELQQMGLSDLSRWTQPEEALYSALVAFNRILASMQSPEESKSKEDMEEWMVVLLCKDVVDSNVLFSLAYFDDQRQKELQDLSSPILRLIAVATLGIEFEWTDGWLPKFLQSAAFKEARWSVSRLLFRYSPFIKNCPMLWQLRLQWWIHFAPHITQLYLEDVLKDLNTLVRAGFFHVKSTSIHRFPQKCVEEELQSSQLGIDHAGDFFVALFHLSTAYAWAFTYLEYHTAIPDILTGHTPSLNANYTSDNVIQHLSSICGDINTDTARLIRVLIELIRADIGHRPHDRRPQNLFNLLNHAKLHLHGKELEPFSPSCQRLTLYIEQSYKQFEDEWDETVQDDIYGMRRHYEKVNRAALKSVYDDVIALLELKESWDGEQKDVSWPRHLLDIGLDNSADA
ncbi:hypothetical protein FRC17_002784 [Serendipita sp. 399]|nr:hypothetical protein FRC17_002784 [Serendipita sp. 399]